MAQRIVLAVLFIGMGSVARIGALNAQVTCACGDPKEFGSCITGAIDYPGEFPGSAVVVPTKNAQGQDVVYLYVADLYSGVTFRYSVPPNEIVKSTTPYDVLFSPGGSQSTSGLSYDPGDGTLYWAIGDKIYRTDLDIKLSSIQPVVGPGDKDLATLLKERLGLRTKGSLGGLTLHQARSTADARMFWTLDIVNDIYFEFVAQEDDGGWHLALNEENGSPVYFRNPMLTPFGGGAYGNGITAVSMAGRSYFDIPVGSLLDLNSVQVFRVHADADSEGRFAIGDLTGYRYQIGPAAGKTTFISGIAYWPATCQASNHTEILLDIVQPGLGKSRIIQVSADAPTATNLADFQAQAQGNNVKLSWSAPGPYQKLEITRDTVPASTAVAVVTMPPPATDPGEFIDHNVGDGLYEYSAVVTSPAGSKLQAVKTRINVGPGTIATSRFDVTVTATGTVLDSRHLLVTTVDVTYPDPKKVSAGWIFRQGTRFAVVNASADKAAQSYTLTLDRPLGVAAGKAQLEKPVAISLPALDPFPLAYISSLEELLVVDRRTGIAQVLAEKTVIARAKNAPALDVPAPETAGYSLYQGSDTNAVAIQPLNQGDRVGFKKNGAALVAVAGAQEIPIGEDDSYWKMDLKQKSTLSGPFINDARSGGLTTGVTYAPDTNRLIWSLQSSLGSFLQTTEVTGALVGARVRVRVPVSLHRAPIIGDLSYDAVRKEIWGVDQANMVAYSFDASGVLTGNSNTVQLTPKVAGGPDRDFGGGLAVVESTGQSLVIDCSVGLRSDTESPGDLARMSYPRSGAAGDLSVPGTQTLGLDLRSILLAEEIGGIEAHPDNPVAGLNLDYRFVIGADTQTVYKLTMNTGLRGKQFKRGDVNVDNSFNISDPITILNFLFLSKALKCADAADLDDNEQIDINDPLLLFQFLFMPNGQDPPAPYPACGRDFDPPLFCDESACP